MVVFDDIHDQNQAYLEQPKRRYRTSLRLSFLVRRFTFVCMPQTIAFVSLEKSGRSKLTFRTSPLALAFILEVLSDAAKSSLFYKGKRILLQINLK